MKIIEDASTKWSGKFTCHKCSTIFEADQDDLEVDGFKKEKNTYWFDGSAISVQKVFVWCPHRCDLLFVDHSTLPFLLRKKLL